MDVPKTDDRRETVAGRKKVLYVITKSNWGGAQKYVYDLATSLPDQFEPVVAFGGVGPTGVIGLLGDRLDKAGIRTVSIASLGRDISVGQDIKSFFALLRLIRSERPYIVHVNSSKVGGLGALASRLARVPRIIFTCHGWPFNEERGLAALWAIRIASWATTALSHTTIVVSERDMRDGSAMPLVTHKLKLVHNGVRKPRLEQRDTARAFIIDAAKAKNIAIPADAFIVGSIGELHKNKGYEYLLQAVAALPRDVYSVVVSEGEERGVLEERARTLGVADRVALVGFIDGVARYLQAFDAFALTSIKEGLPYVLIEAGYAALPVVSTNVGGAGEIVEDMKTGILVQTRKSGDIAQAILLMKNEPERARTFGNALRAEVMRKFSLSRMVEQTVEIYENRA